MSFWRSAVALICALFPASFPALFLASLVAVPSAQASIRGCDPSYLESAYSEAHRLAAIEGAMYALLANNAYDDASQPQFRLPADWQLLQRGQHGDLQYQLYLHQRDGLPTKRVIAFRGTDSGRDWWSGSITGEQYELAAEIVRQVQAQYPDGSLVATGHSLGGGLALHVSMRFPGISAYAFNPSPLVREPATVIRNRRVIYWEANDLLHWGRRAFSKTPDAVYWRFSFVKGDGHKATVLAKGLLMLGALMNPELANTLQQNCAINPLG